MSDHSITRHEVEKGQAIYTKWTLHCYNLIVLNLSNNYLWHCPTSRIQRLYQENISSNHLEVGVGTGYFLEHCRFKQAPRLALMDLNKSCLDLCVKNLRRYNPESYQKNIYEPLNLSIPPFDSLGINYVLHCLPGSIRQKSAVFAHLKPLLKDGAAVFGSTILGKNVSLNAVARLVTGIYNKKGVFSNLEDDLDGVKEILEENFTSSHVETAGNVALFQARV